VLTALGLAAAPLPRVAHPMTPANTAAQSRSERLEPSILVPVLPPERRRANHRAVRFCREVLTNAVGRTKRSRGGARRALWWRGEVAQAVPGQASASGDARARPVDSPFAITQARLNEIMDGLEWI